MIIHFDFNKTKPVYYLFVYNKSCQFVFNTYLIFIVINDNKKLDSFIFKLIKNKLFVVKKDYNTFIILTKKETCKRLIK